MANKTTVQLEIAAISTGFDDLQKKLDTVTTLNKTIKIGLDTTQLLAALKDVGNKLDAFAKKVQSYDPRANAAFTNISKKVAPLGASIASQTPTFLSTKPGANDFFTALTKEAGLVDKARNMVTITREWAAANKGLADPALLRWAERFAVSQDLVAHGMEKGRMSIRNFSLSMQMLKTEIKDLIFWQARWYATKALVFAPLQLGTAIFTEGFAFSKLISDWEGKLLRWSATSGKVTDQARQDIKALVLDIRKAALDSPMPFEEIAKSAESFISAGIPERIIKSIIPQLAQLKTAFPEINSEQFGVAITGVYNAMKDNMKGLGNEGEKIIEITEKLLRAQAKGVIRPEQFVQVIQHLGEMSRQAGFTVDEMLSLSVLVTDLGSRAGNAARSLRGMMETLVKSKSEAELKKLGVVIDHNKTLASQFVPIMIQLRKALGEPGEKSYGALQALAKIFPVERVKSANIAMDFLDKYLSLVFDIGHAEGGLAAAAAAMTQTVSGQLGILQNRWKELTGTIFTSNGVLSGSIKLLNDMALGGLLAIGNKAVVAGHSVSELGQAGTIVFGIMSGLSGAFQTLGVALKALITLVEMCLKPFLAIGDAFIRTGESIKVLASIITTVLIGALSMQILSWVAATKALGGFIAFLQLLPLALRSTSAAMALFYAANLPIFLAIATFVALIATIERYKKEANKSAEDAEAQTETTKAAMSKLSNQGYWKIDEKTGKQVWVEPVTASIEALDGAIKNVTTDLGDAYDELRKFDAEALKVPALTEAEKEAGATVDEKSGTTYDRAAIERKIAARQAELTELKLKQQALFGDEVAKKNLKVPTVTDDSKARFPGDLADIKKWADNEIKTIRDKEAMKLAEMTNSHQLLLKSDADFYRESLDLAIDANEKEINILEFEKHKITDKFNLNMGRAKKTEEKKAIQADYDNAIAEINRKELDLTKETQKKILDTVKNVELARRKFVQDRLDYEAEMMKVEQKRIVAMGQFRLDEEKKQRDWLYNQNKLDPTVYYQQEEAAMRHRFDLSMQLINSEANEFEIRMKEKKRLAEEALQNNNPFLMEAYDREYNKEHQKILDDRLGAEKEYFANVKEYARKSADDIKKIFADWGVGGVIGKAAEDMSKAYGNMAEHIKTSFETSMNALETGFEEIFTGLQDGTLKWEETMIKTLKTITNEIIKTFAIKPFMAGLTGVIGETTKGNSWFSNLFKGLWGQGSKLGKGTEEGIPQGEFGELGGWFAPMQNLMTGLEFQTNLVTISLQQLEQAARMAAQALSQITGGGGGGLGSLFGGENMSSLGGWDSSAWAGDFSGSFAKGGKIGLNKLALIGENGPELFKPSTSGTIIPNGMLGGQPTVTSVVNVINQTKTPVSAKQSEVKFNGKEYIVNVVLDELTNNYGPLRHAVKGVK